MWAIAGVDAPYRDIRVAHALPGQVCRANLRGGKVGNEPETSTVCPQGTFHASAQRHPARQFRPGQVRRPDLCR